MTAIAVLGNFESSWVNIHVRSHGRKSIRSWGGWIDGEVSPPILTRTSILNCPFLKLILLEQTPLLTCFFFDTSKVACFKENQLKKSIIFNRCRSWNLVWWFSGSKRRGRKLGFAKTSFLAEKCTHQLKTPILGPFGQDYAPKLREGNKVWI
jgi:hypothetical protein